MKRSTKKSRSTSFTLSSGQLARIRGGFGADRKANAILEAEPVHPVTPLCAGTGGTWQGSIPGDTDV